MNKHNKLIVGNNYYFLAEDLNIVYAQLWKITLNINTTSYHYCSAGGVSPTNYSETQHKPAYSVGEAHEQFSQIIKDSWTKEMQVWAKDDEE